MTDLPTAGGRWLMTRTGQLRRFPETDTDDAAEVEPLPEHDAAPETAAPETPAEADAPAKSKGKA